MEKHKRFELAFGLMKQTVSHFVQNHHYDVNKQTRVKCVASKQGLGATLRQLHTDGWKSISYASRLLNAADLDSKMP